MSATERTRGEREREGEERERGTVEKTGVGRSVVVHVGHSVEKSRERSRTAATLLEQVSGGVGIASKDHLVEELAASVREGQHSGVPPEGDGGDGAVQPHVQTSRESLEDGGRALCLPRVELGTAVEGDDVVEYGGYDRGDGVEVGGEEGRRIDGHHHLLPKGPGHAHHATEPAERQQIERVDQRHLEETLLTARQDLVAQPHHPHHSLPSPQVPGVSGGHSVFLEMVQRHVRILSLSSLSISSISSISISSISFSSLSLSSISISSLHFHHKRQLHRHPFYAQSLQHRVVVSEIL